jgi:hypothetical protein
MDHQAFAQLLGNYGEFVGAIAVVVTLIYLAIQVRDGKKATEANTRSIRAQSIHAVNQGVASNISNITRADSALFATGLTGYAELSFEDRTRFAQLMTGIYLSIDAMFWLREEDSLPDGIWRREINGLKAWLQTPGGLAVWERSMVSKELRDYVQTNVAI